MKRRRRVMPPDGIWRQAGSGCLLVGHKKFPFDATYWRRFKAGRWEELTIAATMEAGRGLPLKSATERDIVLRSGVVVTGRAWWVTRV